MNQSDLDQFTGTEHWYKAGRMLCYTDGIKFLAEQSSCKS